VLAVFDIDGVVADVRHRLHHLHRPGRWAQFFRAADADPLLAEGAALVADLAREHDIVWLTGRPDWLRDTTAGWLAQHGLPGTELHMRPDDREVIDAALAAGYPAALADWVPREDPYSDALHEAQERFGRT
jgi:hypothetical protein